MLMVALLTLKIALLVPGGHRALAREDGIQTDEYR
jgi:hypothetical protein